jgi:excisionase family DNA binding protein
MQAQSRVSRECKRMEGFHMVVEQGEKHIFSPEEAAKYLNISARKLTYLIEARQIVSFKIGKSRRISLAAIRDFIRKAEREAR